MAHATLAIDPGSARLVGALAVVGAGLAWSMGGLLVRATESDTWSILIFRSLAVAISIGLVLAWRRQGRVWPAIRALGWSAPLGGLFIAVAMSGFVFALSLTTVFNAMMMLSTGPVIAAGLGWLVMRETVRRATWGAIALAMVGVAVMVWDGLATDSLSGNLLALLSVLCFAGYTVLARASKVEDSTPCVLLAGLFAAALALGMALAEGGVVWVGLHDLLLCFAMGSVQIAFGFVLYSFGARRVPAAEATLLAQTEALFGPLWVWFAFAERPSDPALIGGLILLSAVVFQAASGLRKRRPPVGIV